MAVYGHQYMACFLIYLMMSGGAGWGGTGRVQGPPPPPKTGSVTVTVQHQHHFHLSDSRTGHIIDSTLEN